MVHFKLDMRGIPLWLLQAYLEELGGHSTGAGYVEGEGWSAQLEQLEDYQIGSLRVGQVRLELEASEEVFERLHPQLEKKMMRAGG
jgi:hypothetical protein